MYEATGFVTVCVQKDSTSSTDFNVTVQTLSGTAHGEEIRIATLSLNYMDLLSLGAYELKFIMGEDYKCGYLCPHINIW